MLTLSKSSRERLAAVGIVLLAAALRLWRLDDVPGGLLFDEAFNGRDVLNVLAGAHPVFFRDNFGREPLFIYAQAGCAARTADGGRRGDAGDSARRVLCGAPRRLRRTGRRSQPRPGAGEPRGEPVGRRRAWRRRYARRTPGARRWRGGPQLRL